MLSARHGLIHIPGEPGEAVAGGKPFDAQFLGGFYLAPFAGLGLDELNDANAQPASPGAQDNAKRGGGFSLSISGIDNHQSFFMVCHVASSFERKRSDPSSVAG